MASLIAHYQASEDPVPVQAVADLDALLDRMAADHATRSGPVPPMVELSRPDPWAEGWVIVRLGVDHDRGFLAHADASGSFITTGGADRHGTAVVYDHMGHPREFPADAEVPLHDLRKAAHDLITTDGGRSPAVAWRPWER
ncbi:Imm1 family immunity protein [Saccharothrix algeriensis]|uniref:Immunity protein Imm1 n=3 Tax=Saccharothrix algeriensis TaxID=173560 RepID=A0ABS2S2B1_9PSEU|nr:Imm1 family immunity protein [Saccharothrix algeriensis]MBM7810049.1 hypothetical protein [Saccharothrix algeriensis]